MVKQHYQTEKLIKKDTWRVSKRTLVDCQLSDLIFTGSKFTRNKLKKKNLTRASFNRSIDNAGPGNLLIKCWMLLYFINLIVYINEGLTWQSVPKDKAAVTSRIAPKVRRAPDLASQANHHMRMWVVIN